MASRASCSAPRSVISLQALRTPLGYAVMIAVTELGDATVALVVAPVPRPILIAAA